MQELIKEFKETGPCLVDVEKVVSAWNDKFFISQYQDKYTLIEEIELFKEEHYKCVISEEQAVDIIKKASLLQIKYTFFKQASTYRSRSNIISEIDRLEKILNEGKLTQVLKDTIDSYKEALNYEQGKN
jgi:hypothetical protein